jgi:iron complex transport system substrate-binding protein
MRRAGWSDVPAIRDGRVHPISEAWLGRPGPRLLAGFDKLAQVVGHCIDS